MPFSAIIFTINSILAFWVFLFFLIILIGGFCYEKSLGALEVLPAVTPTHYAGGWSPGAH